MSILILISLKKKLRWRKLKHQIHRRAAAQPKQKITSSAIKITSMAAIRRPSKQADELRVTSLPACLPDDVCSSSLQHAEFSKTPQSNQQRAVTHLREPAALAGDRPPHLVNWTTSPHLQKLSWVIFESTTKSHFICFKHTAKKRTISSSNSSNNWCAQPKKDTQNLRRCQGSQPLPP